MRVSGVQFGGTPIDHELPDGATVQVLRTAMGIPAQFVVMVNGEPADDATALQAGGYVSFAPAIKGGRKWYMLPNKMRRIS